MSIHGRPWGEAHQTRHGKWVCDTPRGVMYGRTLDDLKATVARLVGGVTVYAYRDRADWPPPDPTTRKEPA